MAADHSLPPAAESASGVASPPWQVRWKRPQWDRVVVGIDDDDFTDDGQKDNHEYQNHSRDGFSLGQECEDDNDLHLQQPGIDRHWQPVSCSSAVLTRGEARVAILELSKRGKILVRRRKDRKSEKLRVSNNLNDAHAATGNSSEAEEDGNNLDPKSHDDDPNFEFPGSPSGQPTPRNKNTKHIDTTPSEVTEGIKSNNLSSEGKGSIENETSHNFFTPTTPTNTQGRPSNSSKKRSFTSPSKWLFGSISDKDNANSDRGNLTPPRSSQSRKNLNFGNASSSEGRAKKSPSSPTSFSTFANFVSPNFGSKSKNNDTIKEGNDDIKAGEKGVDSYEDDDIGTNTHAHSPPTIDASTASSLLWEDMTLTSVSEEDAAAFRMKKVGGGFGGSRGFWGVSGRLDAGSFGRSNYTTNGRDNADNDVEQTSSSRIGSGGILDGVRLRFEEASQFDDGGGKFYCDSRGNLRLSEWDGFDNVVLTVTIFATKPASSSDLSDGKQCTKSAVKKKRRNHRPTSGDVVLMELLSTKNPPTCDSPRSPTLNKSNHNRNHSRGDIAAAAAAAAKWGKREKNTYSQQINISSSSSSSSIPNNNSNPLFQSRGLKISCGYTTGTSGTEEDSTSPTKQLQHENSSSNEAEEKEIPSNHTRVLARRVLRWPTSMLGRHGIADDHGDFYCDEPDFPMIVSLGRTSKWKESKQRGDDNHREKHSSNTSSCKQVQHKGSSIHDDDSGIPNDDRDDYGLDDGDDDEDENNGLLESEHHHVDEDDDNADDGMAQDETENEKIKSENSKLTQVLNIQSCFDQFFDQEERVADAREAIQSLNFLFGCDSALFERRQGVEKDMKVGDATNSGTVTEVSTNKIARKSTRRKKLSQPLSLCFVTSDGSVHFFYALSVFLSRKSHNVTRGRKSNSFISSFASFLMGRDLFASVCEDIAPLSNPKATVRLSQLSKALPIRDHGGDDVGIDPASWDKILSRDRRNLDSKNQLPHHNYDVNDNNWSQLSTFDASIDSSTLIYRTLPRSNVITGACITSDVSNGHLAVCGKGLRRIAENDKRNRNYHGLGGFVTFVSLRHYSESRTIYLPFSPESAHPVYWDDMHFVILLGEEGSPVPSDESKFVSSFDSCGESMRWADAGAQQGFFHQSDYMTRCRQPYAVAIRVDSKIDVGDKVLLPQPLRFPLDGKDRQVQFAIKDSLLSSSARSFNSSVIGNSIRSSGSKLFESKDSNAIFMPKVQTWHEDSDYSDEHSSDLFPQNHRYIYRPRRFQPIQILFPSADEAVGHLSHLIAQDFDQSRVDLIRSTLLSVSAVPSSPPGIVSIYHFDDQENSTPFAVVVNHTLDSFHNNEMKQTTCMFLSSIIRVGHRVLLSLDKTNEHTNTTKDGEHLCPILDKSPFPCKIWCTGGQGWSIIGSQQLPGFVYFISWDGATDAQGPFLFQLNLPESRSCYDSRVCIAVSETMPLMNYITYTEDFLRTFMSRGDRSTDVELPFSTLYSLSSFPQPDNDDGITDNFSMNLACSSTLKESIKEAIEIEGSIDDVILTALQSISSPSPPPSDHINTPSFQRERPNRSKSLAMSHAEKSRRLLRHCSSWTQLDDKRANRGIVTGQVIMATVRFGTSQSCLTFRTNVVTNPNATPYHQVLAWLCQRRDYFTAASIALSLLQDFDAVYELRGIPKTSEGEVISHQGLLDGITPLLNDDMKGGKFSRAQLHTLTSLADMTVGCLIKGGTVMASTLDGFLARNPFYDAPRACLMLVGTVAAVISQESPIAAKHYNSGNIIKILSSLESPREDILWPVRCLLKMAVTRKCLSSVLLMLNATIPNELRWRSPKTRGLSESPRPSLSLCLAIVEMILESANEATRYFLNLRDEESCLPYWFSIDDKTCLALSILSIHGKFVMLKEPEVRSWALEKLKDEINSSVDFNDDQSDVPSEWLKEIVTGTFCNAECDIGLGLDSSVLQKLEDFESTQDEYKSCYRHDMLRIENLLTPQRHSGGLDYDLLIASLLILVQRDENWRDGTSISTQVLLNVVCDKAGRKTDIDQKFMFDGATTMRLCALCENYQATAFLVGGINGIILECADIIISNLGISIKEAELLLFAGSVHEMKDFVTRIYHKVPIEKKRIADFFPSVSHQHLLWLLEQYSMNVHKYGEFNTAPSSARINPVVAGRVCFRAWICLTHPSDKELSAQWLEKWLRNNLGLENGVSSKRLVCAALVRTLLWADEASGLELGDGDEEPLLAVLLGLNGRFMAELAHACCGMVEAIPPHLADEIMSGLGGSNLFFFETELLNS